MRHSIMELIVMLNESGSNWSVGKNGEGKYFCDMDDFSIDNPRTTGDVLTNTIENCLEIWVQKHKTWQGDLINEFKSRLPIDS